MWSCAGNFSGTHRPQRSLGRSLDIFQDECNECTAIPRAGPFRFISIKHHCYLFSSNLSQGGDTICQRRHITDVLRRHYRFEATWHPREEWARLDSSHAMLGVELFNMTLPASKATALCYSMTLGDFHNLFIGTLPQ